MPSKPNQIADCLVSDILHGNYRSGERLPSERDLASRFATTRGAVREAIKTVSQLGLAAVQPGGSRVCEPDHASLDIIGHLLSQSDTPDPNLIDQILVVVSSLISIAADNVIQLGSDEELANLADLVDPLMDQSLDYKQHSAARIQLMMQLMLTSRNLPLRLIANTLMQQLAPNVPVRPGYNAVDRERYAIYAKHLKSALLRRDGPLLQSTLRAFSTLNRETVVNAVAHTPSTQEGSQND